LKLSVMDEAFVVAPLESFVSRYPQQPRTAGVRKKLEEAEAAHAAALSTQHTKHCYQRYLRNWPNGTYSAEAQRLLAGGGDDRMWIEVLKEPTTARLNGYLAEWPDGRHITEAKKRRADAERREKTMELGRNFGLAGIGLGGLAVLGVAVFTSGSLLWALGQSAMNHNGSLIDWARTSLAELIKPKPEPAAIEPAWRGTMRGSDIKIDSGLADGPSLGGLRQPGSDSVKAIQEKTPNMPKALAPTSGAGSPASTLTPWPGIEERWRNIKYPNQLAPGETEQQYQTRLSNRAQATNSAISKYLQQPAADPSAAPAEPSH
jgi:hypothetical protein